MVSFVSVSVETFISMLLDITAAAKVKLLHQLIKNNIVLDYGESKKFSKRSKGSFIDAVNLDTT